jgi:hypothetical protein
MNPFAQRQTVTVLIRIAAALALIVSAASAHAISTGEAPQAPSIVEAGSIPPNCTLNPWTHKYVCHKWPKKKLAVIG